jgi:hypothetical protein
LAHVDGSYISTQNRTGTPILNDHHVITLVTSAKTDSADVGTTLGWWSNEPQDRRRLVDAVKGQGREIERQMDRMESDMTAALWRMLG